MKKIINFYNEVKYKNKKILPLHEPHISNIDKENITMSKFWVCINIWKRHPKYLKKN